MKKYGKMFMHRGLLFGGFGPIVVGIVYAIHERTAGGFSLDGVQILVAIVSAYVLAFLQAGTSVFNQIEGWSLPKSMLCHFSLLYVAYVTCYLINDWIPFRAGVFWIFTAAFAAGYLVVWLTVCVSVKLISRRLNRRIG